MSLHDAAEAAELSIQDRTARYARNREALYSAKTGWEANDPGIPDSWSGPGSPPISAFVYTLADEDFPATFPPLSNQTLANCEHLLQHISFAEQGHNHTEERFCADFYTQIMPNGTRRRFDPLDYEPGGDPQENVIPPCPAHDAESTELVVTDDDIARRLSACWNALRGISTEALETNVDAIALAVRNRLDDKWWSRVSSETEEEPKSLPF